uniref:Uncharacterized protein n=1 Tax=Anguilla anguilla TaxID=7936 RepID=A0A0E9RSY2_ANGAN
MRKPSPWGHSSCPLLSFTPLCSPCALISVHPVIQLDVTLLRFQLEAYSTHKNLM